MASRGFKDLDVWQQSRALVVTAYNFLDRRHCPNFLEILGQSTLKYQWIALESQAIQAMTNS